MDTVVLDGELSLDIAMDGDASLEMELDGEPENVIKIADFAYPIYTGPVHITPSAERQVLSTTNKTTVEDIIIDPVPSNYGLITWNGSTLTVS